MRWHASKGCKRRLETVGNAGGVTVIDDFAHNPDKIDATLATLRAQPGRLLIMFQPHGYGPLAKMGEELAASLSGGMDPDDRLYLPDPVYQGGTVEKTRGIATGSPSKFKCSASQPHISPTAPPSAMRLWRKPSAGDRILIMGARDDTLIDFARELLERLSG